MQNQLQKALDLSRKTGDRIIVFDTPKSESPFVVMGLAEYEKLVIGKSEVRGLTEDELLDKINRDIAVWKSEQSEENKEGFIDPIFRPKRAGFSSITESDFSDRFTPPSLQDQFESERGKIDKEIGIKQDLSAQAGLSAQTGKKRNHWVIPADRKEGAEEIIEEDTQYLEEIKF